MTDLERAETDAAELSPETPPQSDALPKRPWWKNPVGAAAVAVVLAAVGVWRLFRCQRRAVASVFTDDIAVHAGQSQAGPGPAARCDVVPAHSDGRRRSVQCRCARHAHYEL